jgi:hypothetical protein
VAWRGIAGLEEGGVSARSVGAKAGTPGVTAAGGRLGGAFPDAGCPEFYKSLGGLHCVKYFFHSVTLVFIIRADQSLAKLRFRGSAMKGTFTK